MPTGAAPKLFARLGDELLGRRAGHQQHEARVGAELAGAHQATGRKLFDDLFGPARPKRPGSMTTGLTLDSSR